MVNEEKRPLKVFLCHASGDKPPVRDLYKRLTAEGVDAWLDQEKLLPGQDWRLEIPHAVHEADVVVVCLSKKSITKEGYVQKEIKFALDIAEEKPEGTIFLIPARLEECVVPERLSRWQWVDLYEENGFIKLLRSLKLRANAVGAVIAPISYEDTEKELNRRLDQLYMEGLAAFYTEDWDKACHRFQAILSEQPNHRKAAEKIAEAECQRHLARLYAQATEAYRSENWQIAIDAFDELSKKSPDYRDAAQLLRDARRQKQLKELYTEAKALHAAQKWQAVVKVFKQISVIEPNYPDTEGLLPSAQKEVAELERLAKLDEQYNHALGEMESGNWYEARGLLESIHKSQMGFLETENLLRKVENEIFGEEEKRKQNDQINTLYEQAHGLLRAKKWRNALDKLEQIQKLDEHFPDTDRITEQAQKELEREEQEADRQNNLAALYAEAVRLLKEEKYEQALDKWQAVKAIDPKYPDRQWVQRIAKKGLAESAKPLRIRPRFVITKRLWTGIVVLVAVTVVAIASVILSNMRGQKILPTRTFAPTRNVAVNPPATNVPHKTNTPRPSTPVPATSGYADLTMYDDFDKQSYDNNYNTQLWTLWTDENSKGLNNGYTINQSNGQLKIGVINGKGHFALDSDSMKMLQPFFAETRLYLDPATTTNDTHLNFRIWTGPGNVGFVNCGIFSVAANPNRQGVHCSSDYYGKHLELNIGKNSIEPGWHILRFEVSPDPFEITSFVDGLAVGKFSPMESMPDRYNEIKGSTFVSTIDFDNFGSTKSPVAYIDYVRMGAIEDDPNILLYDDFNNSTYDGSFNKSEWEICAADSGSTVVQNNGVLSLTHVKTPSGYQGTSLCLSKYKNISISVPTYFEGRMMIPDRHFGGMGISAEEYYSGNPASNHLYTNCMYIYFFQSQSDTTQLYCSYSLENTDWRSTINNVTPGVWHTVRIEIQPTKKTLLYYLDGQQYIYQPDVDLSKIKWWFSLFVMADNDVDGYFDDVRIGKIDN